MKKFDVSPALEEKIYDSKFVESKSKMTVTTYFPLSDKEKQDIINSSTKPETEVIFKSIFTDVVSDEEWNKTKEQIKKKFQDELVNID